MIVDEVGGVVCCRVCRRVRERSESVTHSALEIHCKGSGIGVLGSIGSFGE